MEVWSPRSCGNECSLVFLKLGCEVFMELLEVRNCSSNLGFKGWSQVLILVLEVLLFLHSFNLGLFHSWWQLRQFETHFSISLHSFVPLIILIQYGLVEGHKYFPWDFVGTEWSVLRYIIWEFSSLLGGFPDLLVSFVEVEWPLSRLNLGHSEFPVVLRSLSFLRLHLLEFICLDTGRNCSSLVLNTESSFLFLRLVFDHFLDLLLTDGEALLGRVHEFKWDGYGNVILSLSSLGDEVLLCHQFLFELFVQAVLLRLEGLLRLGIIFTFNVAANFGVLLVKLEVDSFVIPQSASLGEETQE